jgi:hypothetical protein
MSEDPRDRKVTIRQKRWQLRFQKMKPKLYGECDPPSEQGKEIRIKRHLKGRIMLDTLLHELWHAAQWDLDETVIEEIATSVASVLWDLGYRAPWDKPND